MKRPNRLLLVFGGLTTVFIFVLFIVQGWAYFNWNEGKPLTTAEPQGKFAITIDNLSTPVFAAAAAVFFAVLLAVLFIGFKFRDRGDLETADEIPAQLHGETVAEIAWTAAPAAVLLVVALGTVVALGELQAAPADNALRVKVEGQQWWWNFTYDTNNDGEFTGEDVSVPNEMVIPTGREIALVETSNDVIHSFWIPALNGKKDAVPGMLTNWKLHANEPGVYMGTCTEFCGLSHANMRMLVRAVVPSDFESWMENQKRPAREPGPDTLAAVGKEVFSGQLCASCHLIRGVNESQVNGDKGASYQLRSGIAPDLTHFATRGTFAGSMFNRTFPNPPSAEGQPFGQTCRVAGVEGSGLDAEGRPVGELPECDPRSANDPDAFNIPWASDHPGNPDNPPNTGALADWLADPTRMKPMAAEDDGADPPLRRGMPNLNLPPDQIQALVAYLNSLT